MITKKDIKPDMVIMAADGDGIGNKVGKAVLSNNFEKLHEISGRIDAVQGLVARWVKEHDGIKISGGGDEFTAAIPKKHVDAIESLRKDIEFGFKFTISVGIGKNLSQAGKALLVAKLKGKDQIVNFDSDTEKEIEEVKKRAKKGNNISMEEIKLSKAYLKKSEEEVIECPYCNQTDDLDQDHCKLCHDIEVEEGKDECPFCKEYDNNFQTNTDDSDCFLCNEMDENKKCPFCEDIQDPGSESKYYKSPEEEREEYTREGMTPPELPKPQMEVIPAAPSEDSIPVGEGDINEDMVDKRVPEQDGGEVVANVIKIHPEDNHSRDAMLAIAQEIEKDGNPDQEEVNAIDDSEMPDDGDMEGNVSRPGGFDTETPSDMGMHGTNDTTYGEEMDDEEEDPDFSDILEEGLSTHADSIHKDRVLQTVTQALSEFKQSKDILEQSKEQMPQLYQSSISMLRAMIELATLVGLNEQSDNTTKLGDEQEMLTPVSEEQYKWSNPFPIHPDHGGEAKEGHSPSSKEKDSDHNSIGQSAAKLPSKNTTKHIAKTPLPIGAVNAKGQQKVMDNQGKVRFIDRKHGLVQGASGVPVKPPSRK